MHDELSDLDLRLLAVLRDLITGLEARTYDQLATTFRWIMASLFTANGGALLALASREDYYVFQGPCLLFASGLLLSIGMGIASGISSYRYNLNLHPARAEIEQMLALKRRTGQAVEKLGDIKVTWRTFYPSYIGVGSFLCLVGGIVAAGVKLF